MVENHMTSIFPGCKTDRIKSVGKNPDKGWESTRTYEVELSAAGGKRRVFVKRFSKRFADSMKKEVKATVRLGKKEEARVPLVHGFFRDINSFIFEPAEGVSLNRYVLSKYMRPPKAKTRDDMGFFVKEVAKGIAFIQNTGEGRDTRFSYESFKAFESNRNPELKNLIESNRKLSGIVDSIDGSRQRMAIGYNDLKASHVYVADGSIKIIDFCPFSLKWFFINPVAFSVSLELAQKAPFFRRKEFQSLRKNFYEEYVGMLGWKVDPAFLEGMEILKKCELLCYFRNALKSGAPLKHSVSMKLDMKRLLKGIRDSGVINL